MSTQELESILTQVEQLSTEDQLQLIKRVAEMLTKSNKAEEPHRLIYGKYRDTAGSLSTEEDFRIAEWHPAEKDLNGP